MNFDLVEAPFCKEMGRVADLSGFGVNDGKPEDVFLFVFHEMLLFANELAYYDLSS